MSKNYITVPMLNPSIGNSPFIDELKQTACKVLESGQYILGEEVQSFEKECANYLNVDHAIGVSSGTDALLAAMMALDIGPGDEVICPSFTFFATAGSIARLGATPVFVDILPECFTIDPKEVVSAITSKTRAIIPVHLFGQCADMWSLTRISELYKIPIIEDTAQAIGSSYGSLNAGTIGDIGCFSFFPSKNLGGFGDGGLVTTNNKELAEKIISIRNHGSYKLYHHNKVGGNFRLDAMQAALLRIKLKYLPKIESKRIEHAKTYTNKLLNTSYKIPKVIRGKHVFNQFTIRTFNNRRDQLQGFLRARKISSAVYYPLPLHQQECFSHLTRKDLPITEGISKDCLSIPIASELTKTQIKAVYTSLIDFDKAIKND
jgi:dTDP-4-amino-4,6-dideoxygalactose transaminase